MKEPIKMLKREELVSREREGREVFAIAIAVP